MKQRCFSFSDEMEAAMAGMSHKEPVSPTRKCSAQTPTVEKMLPSASTFAPPKFKSVVDQVRLDRITRESRGYNPFLGTPQEETKGADHIFSRESVHPEVEAPLPPPYISGREVYIGSPNIMLSKRGACKTSLKLIRTTETEEKRGRSSKTVGGKAIVTSTEHSPSTAEGEKNTRISLTKLQ